MNSIIDFITKNDSIIMMSLFIVIVILTAIVTIMDFINKRNSNNDDDEINFVNNSLDENNIVLNLNEETPTAIQEQVSEKEEKTTELTEIKYVEDDEELEKTKAKLELENLKEELIKAELENKIKDENKPVYIKDEEDDVIDVVQTKLDEFEQSQEENAIISLEQFNKISDRVYDENEITQYKDEGNEPISIQELEKLYNSQEIKEENLEIVKPEVQTIKAEEVLEVKEEKLVMPENFIEVSPRFKNSPIISPVFGIDTQEKINAIELENTANLGKLDEEIRKTNEFLNTLRELRKNLEP